MSVLRIASRYAKSLLDLAKEQNKLDAVYKDVRDFNAIADSSRDLQLLLKSPIIKEDTKLIILDKIFKGKLDDLTMSFFRIIVKKTREGLLLDITKEFVLQYYKFKGIKKAAIISAIPLDGSIREKVEKAILQTTDSTSIEWEEKVDADIIGGFVLRFDDKLFDASIRHKLDLIAKDFNNNTYIKKF